MPPKLRPHHRNRLGRANSAEPTAPDTTGSAPYYVHLDDGNRVEIIAHARAAGRDNLPLSSATQPNEVEAAVISEHERRHGDLIEQTRSELQSRAGEADHLERQLPAPRDFHVAVQASRAAIEGELSNDHQLIPLRQDQERRRRDLRGFEHENHLTEPARYPASQLFHLGIVAVLVVVESAFNCGFFSEASSLGLVGGFAVAVAVSLTNVMLGLAAGYHLRWRNHRLPRLRRLAAAMIVAYALLTTVFNVGVGHLRDAATQGRALPLRLNELLWHPFSLSFTSLVLVVLGILASLIAARKGFTMDARTPGHGDADRSFRRADQAFREHHQHLQHSILGHAERVPEDLRAIIRRTEELVDQLAQLVVRARKCLEAYEAERARLELWCRLWLGKYRGVNTTIRSTPAPKYFPVFPAFPSQVDDEPVRRLEAHLVRVKERLEELKLEAHSILLDQPARVTAVHDRFESFLRAALRRADAGRGDGSTHHHGERDGEAAS
jgi:hypothetical protein